MLSNTSCQESLLGLEVNPVALPGHGHAPHPSQDHRPLITSQGTWLLGRCHQQGRFMLSLVTLQFPCTKRLRYDHVTISSHSVQYSTHWVLRPDSVKGVEVAKPSAFLLGTYNDQAVAKSNVVCSLDIVTSKNVDGRYFTK